MKITCPTSDFVRAMKACRPAMSGDTVRPHLSCVWIHAVTETKVHLFATDGHWLAVMRLPEVSASETGRFRIDAADVARVLSVAPRHSLPSAETKISAMGRSLTIDFGVDAVLALQTSDEMAPPLETVVPKGKSPKKHGRPSLNSRIVRSAMEAIIAAAGTKQVPIRIVATGPSEIDPQIIWSPRARDFFALVMPMREHAKRDMAWWYETAAIIEAAKVAAKEEQANAAAE